MPSRLLPGYVASGLEVLIRAMIRFKNIHVRCNGYCQLLDISPKQHFRKDLQSVMTNDRIIEFFLLSECVQFIHIYTLYLLDFVKRAICTVVAQASVVRNFKVCMGGGGESGL